MSVYRFQPLIDHVHLSGQLVFLLLWIDLIRHCAIILELCRSALACPETLTNWRTKFYRSPSARTLSSRSRMTARILPQLRSENWAARSAARIGGKAYRRRSAPR